MFCFLFIDFKLLIPKIKSLDLVYVAQKDLTNQIKLQIDRKTDCPSLNRLIEQAYYLILKKKIFFLFMFCFPFIDFELFDTKKF